MSQKFLSTAVLILICGGSAMAQFGRGGGQWATAGGDPQRTGWVRADPQISKENVTKGVVQFLWKTKLDNAPRQLEALTPPSHDRRRRQARRRPTCRVAAPAPSPRRSTAMPAATLRRRASLPRASSV